MLMTPEQECSVEGCDREAKSRGWCRRCYSRWYRHGDPTVVLAKKGRPRVRLGLPHLYLDPPSQTNYNRGCRCDDCMDASCVAHQESRERIAAQNAELWEHIARIRERTAA